MENNQKIYELAQKIGIGAQLPTGDLVCAFVGEWNAGKSSLLNALTGVRLPARPTPTTKTIVRLRRAEGGDPQATLTDAAGQRTTVTGAEALNALDRSTEGLTEITLEAAGLDIPPGIVFVDTPGFNDDDQLASTRAATVQADVVVFVLQATGSVINQTQVDFIGQVLLTKGNLEDIHFVVTHADLLDDASQRAEIEARYREQFGAAAFARLSLVATRDGSGIDVFKQRFYDQLRASQPRLLTDRRQRLGKQLAIQLRHELDRRRALLALQHGQRTEDLQQLETQISAARQKERHQRASLRENHRQRLRGTVDQIRSAADQMTSEIEHLIGQMSMERLQAKGELQEAIRTVLETRFTPVVETQLRELLRAIQVDVDGAQDFSSELLRDLSISLPTYDSPLAKVSAEHLLPLAAIGSIAVFGWISIPTTVLCFLALNARDMGLPALIDPVVSKAKSLAASAYRQSVSIAVARALGGYRDQVIDYLRQTVETVTERALEQINGVEALEKSYRQLRDTTSLLEQEALLDDIASALTAYQFNPSA